MSEWIYSLLSGFAIGAMGSFHCIGMCGPLALSIPAPQENKPALYTSISLYNLGRSMMYGMIGLLFGLLGTPFRLWGLQQFISIIAGVLLLIFVLSRFRFHLPFKWFNDFTNWVQVTLRSALQKEKSMSSYFFIGLINGLLPCGLVYVAIVAALAAGNAWLGGLVMFAFGLGTIPMMASLMLFGRKLGQHQRILIRRVMPYFVSVMACLLILRGLNLGIPFVSPKMGASTKELPTCHGKTEIQIFPVPE